MSCAASLWRVRHVCWHLEIDEVAASNNWTQKVGKNDVRKNQNKSDLNLSLQNMDWIQIHYSTHRRSNANVLVHRSPKKCLSVDTASTWAFFVSVLFGTGSWRLMIGCSRGPCCWIFIGNDGVLYTISKCQVWIGLISFYYTCMGHKLRNTLYITSTENPIVHPASQDLPLGDGLRRLEMGCQKGASESSYTRPVFPNMDLQREIEDFDGLFFVRISFLEVCFCYSWWKKWGSKTGTVAHRKTWGEHILTEKTNTPGV